MQDDRQFFERAMGLALVAALVGACLTIVAPFVVPILWATILTVSTWPLYRRLRDALHGWAKLAATIMVLVLFVLLVAPIVVLITSLADSAHVIAGLVTDLTRLRAPQPPDWLSGLPVIGGLIDTVWREAASNLGATLDRVQPYVGQVTGWLLQRGAGLGRAVIEFLVAILITGVLYVTGEPAVLTLERFVHRIGGPRNVALVVLAGRTIRGVAQGVIGTAIFQAMLSALGLVIAGVPGVVLLAFIVFMIGVMQLPTAIVLVPIAGWLFWHDHTWQAVFLAIWALTVVNTLDNFVRPYLISHGANLPFLLIFTGVVGGLFAYGFIGIFVGATLLAVSYTLFKNWLAAPPEHAAEPVPRLVLPEELRR